MRRFLQRIASAATASVVPLGLACMWSLRTPAEEGLHPGAGEKPRCVAKEIRVTPKLIELAKQRRVYRSHAELRAAMEDIAAEQEWYEIRVAVRADGKLTDSSLINRYPYHDPEHLAEAVAVLQSVVQIGPELQDVSLRGAKVIRVEEGQGGAEPLAAVEPSP